jgi:hypothetical protein
MKKWIEVTGLGVGFFGALVGVVTLGYTVYVTPPKLPIVKLSSRFYCDKQAAPDVGGEFWTVMYKHDNGSKPWLRMVKTMGDGWDLEKRCNAIAERLERYREDKLLELDYRADPNTPKQSVICAKTKLSSGNCPLILTLLPDDDPYKALHAVAGALLPGSLPSYQCDNSKNCPPPKSLTIPLSAYLAAEDL